MVDDWKSNFMTHTKTFLSFNAGLWLWLVLATTGCASAPRVTLEQIPVYPGAVALVAGQHVIDARSVAFVVEQGQALRRNFKLTGAHAESNYRVPRGNESADAQRTAIKAWYFEKLDQAGWRSNYATAAYTTYVNGAGQYLTIYVMSGAMDADDFELILALDE